MNMGGFMNYSAKVYELNWQRKNGHAILLQHKSSEDLNEFYLNK